MSSRRIAALVLPQLGCELVRQRLPLEGPLGVLFARRSEGSGEERDKATATLDLVDEGRRCEHAEQSHGDRETDEDQSDQAPQHPCRARFRAARNRSRLFRGAILACSAARS